MCLLRGTSWILKYNWARHNVPLTPFTWTLILYVIFHHVSPENTNKYFGRMKLRLYCPLEKLALEKEWETLSSVSTKWPSTIQLIVPSSVRLRKSYAFALSIINLSNNWFYWFRSFPHVCPRLYIICPRGLLLVSECEEIRPISTSPLMQVEFPMLRGHICVSGYSLTPYSTFLLKKLIGSYVFKKLPAYCGKSKVLYPFFTRTHHWLPPWNTWIVFRTSHSVSKLFQYYPAFYA